jgi:hypothetical protein
MSTESISLDELAETYKRKKQHDSDDEDEEYNKKNAPILRVSNIKLIISLFLWFLFIVSDIFRDSVLSEIGSHAVKGREITTWGVVIQGTFLIIGYIILVYLTEHEIL